MCSNECYRKWINTSDQSESSILAGEVKQKSKFCTCWMGRGKKSLSCGPTVSVQPSLWKFVVLPWYKAHKTLNKMLFLFVCFCIFFFFFPFLKTVCFVALLPFPAPATDLSFRSSCRSELIGHLFEMVIFWKGHLGTRKVTGPSFESCGGKIKGGVEAIVGALQEGI